MGERGKSNAKRYQIRDLKFQSIYRARGRSRESAGICGKMREYLSRAWGEPEKPGRVTDQLTGIFRVCGARRGFVQDFTGIM